MPKTLKKSYLHTPSKYLYMCGCLHIVQCVYIFHGMTHLHLFNQFVVEGGVALMQNIKSIT